MINGMFMRYSGDDYCYGESLTRIGFWKTQWVSYFVPQAYNGNRYSSTFFSDLSGLFGPYMNGILPAVSMLLWFLVVMLALNSIVRFSAISLYSIEVILIAELVIFFTLYQAPSISQSLYWRSGMLPYLAPLITNTLLIAIILNSIRKDKYNPLMLGIIFLLAFVSGGFSETATAFQIGYLILMLVGVIFLQNRYKSHVKSALYVIGTALISSILAMLVLAVSPSNVERLSRTSQADLLSLFTISIKSAISFIIESLINLPVSIGILFIFSIGISYIFFTHLSPSIQIKKTAWITVIILVPVVCFVLIVFSAAPSAYAQSAYPEARALIGSRNIMVLSIITLGILFGLIIQQSLTVSQQLSRIVRYSMVLILGIMCQYPIYTASKIFSEVPTYQRWASFWDERDQAIRVAKENNVSDVEVIKIDHIIPSVGDLSEDPNYWYNICAAGYYGVHTITADLPGWDIPSP
ncbi:MAG: hypothetical protein FIA98_04805 [Anaerolineae bacterium]|nr:hypothetical protein [Anaerolineae bacterium]